MSTIGLNQDVFIGGDVDLAALADTANISELLATGRVGFYSQVDGITPAIADGTLPGIVQGMTNTGPGEAEINIQNAQYALSWFEDKWQSEYLNNGLDPTSINMNIDFNSSTWTTDFAAMVTAAHDFGVTSIAPIFSPNDGTYSLTDFATNPDYAAIRQAALLGGGLVIDSPPDYFFQRSGAYQDFIYQEIQWAHDNAIRATVIISPHQDDANFLYDSEAFVHLLEWHNATPSEWVIENYTPSDPNGIGTETDPNSMAGVALWVAQNAQTADAPPTTPAPTPTVAFHQLASIQEAAWGSGVTVMETLATTYLAGPIYIGVETSAGNIESAAFSTIDLNIDGTATFAVSLEHSLDMVLVEDNLVDPDAVAKSAPVTITEPLASFTLSDPGTISVAPYGAGGTAHGTVHAVNVVGSMAVADVSATGVIEGSFETISLDANGNGTFALYLANTGDRVLAEVYPGQPAGLAESAPVSFVDPAMSMTLGALGTHLETAWNAGVDVTETITTTSMVGPIYVGVATGAGAIEGIGFQTVALAGDGTAGFTVHLAHNGDYVIAESDLDADPALLVKSPQVAITEPTASFTLSDPGTITPSASGMGGTAYGTVHAVNVVGSMSVADVSATGVIEGSFETVQLDQSGNGTYALYLANAGDRVLAEVYPNQPAGLAESAPVSFAAAIPCFVEGSAMLTPAGGVPVEALRSGDAVVTCRSGVRGIATVRWTGHRHVVCRRHPDPEATHPVRIRADAFAVGMPFHDLWLSPDHAVYVDNVLIPVKHLINGVSILSEPRDSVTYWHVELDRHDVVLAEGLPTESYLDTGNRSAFSNGGGMVQMHPDFAHLSLDNACAEFVEGGARVVAVRRGLFARAGISPVHPLLRLRVSAAPSDLEPSVLAPEILAPGVWRYAIPPRVRSLQLSSPAWVPAGCVPESLDRRRLGVRLFDVVIDGTPVGLDSAVLFSGFHATEETAEGVSRWTTGEARLVLPIGVGNVELRVGDGANSETGSLAKAA